MGDDGRLAGDVQEFLDAIKLPAEARRAMLDRGEGSAEMGWGGGVAELLKLDLENESRGFGFSPPRIEGLSLLTTVDPDEASRPGSLPSTRRRPDRLRGGDVIDRFEIIRLLGRGGMGVVYLAHEHGVKRDVALKLLAAGQSPARFLREAQAIARLTHPGIVRLYSTGEFEGAPYFAMEYVQGEALSDRIDSSANGFLPPKEAARIIRVVAEAIGFAHAEGVLHRDLKPSNIFLDQQGNPRVGDFGLAKHAEDDFELTHTGDVFGSPQFMAPEQASGATRLIAETTDVYGLGVTLYTALCGQPPFRGARRGDVLSLVIDQPPAPPSRQVAGVPLDLETICLKCLEKEGTQRYPSAAALADDLNRFLRNEPILARRISHLEKARRWCRRKPVAAGLVAAVSAVLFLIAASIGREAAFARQSRSQLSQTLVTRSDLFAQQGKWREALSDLEAAEQLGSVDPRLVELKRTSACLAVSDTDGYEKSLRRLESMRPLGPFEGKASLIRGLSLLTIGETDAAVARFRLALQAEGLAPAEREIALAMLADDSREVARRLASAVEADPTSHFAQQYLISMLVLLGRYEEAATRAAVAAALFPESPTFPMLRVLIAAALGGDDLAHDLAALPQTNQVSASELAMFKASILTLQELTSRFAGVWAVDSTDDEFGVDQEQLLLTLAPLLDRWTEVLHERAGDGVPNGVSPELHAHLGVPCVEKAFRPLTDMTSLRTFGYIFHGKGSRERIERITADLQESFEQHPDAVFQLSRGRLLYAQGRLEDALRAYDTGAEHASLWRRVPKHAAYSAAFCALELHQRGDHEALLLAGENLRRCSPYTGFAQKRIAKLSEVAEAVGDYDAAWRLAKLLPPGPLSELRLASAAYGASEYAIALGHCGNASLHPETADAADQIRSQIVAQLTRSLSEAEAPTREARASWSGTDGGQQPPP